MFVIKNITAANMKKYRLWLNLSQEVLAKIFGVATDTYARWERGEQIPESSNLVALGFEALLNRKLLEEAMRLDIEHFKDLSDQSDFYRKQIDEMQKIGRRRVRHPTFMGNEESKL